MWAAVREKPSPSAGVWLWAWQEGGWTKPARASQPHRHRCIDQYGHRTVQGAFQQHDAEVERNRQEDQVEQLGGNAGERRQEKVRVEDNQQEKQQDQARETFHRY